MCGVSCADKTSVESSESAAETPNISVSELIAKNTVSEMLENNDSLQVTFTDKGNKNVILTQSVWYYSYDNAALRVDYRYKKDSNETTELGTYYDGVYYGLKNEVTYLQFYPQENFKEYVYSFAEMDFSGKQFDENALAVVDDELVLKGKSVGEDGNNYTWSYSFDKETHALKKAIALVYKPNGTFVKTKEFSYDANVADTWERVAYQDITNPEHGETVNVTAKYVKNGKVSHERNVKISKFKNLYAKDMFAGVNYCVYADQACTQLLADLRHVTKSTATVYVAEAKEEDVAKRNLMFAQRDNALSSIVEEHGSYYARYKAYGFEEELIGERHWYYDAHLTQTDSDAQSRTEERMTFDYLQKETGGKITRVVNFRENAFYIYSTENGAERREFSIVLDEDYKSVVFAHGSTYLGAQQQKTAMSKTEDGYTFVTTKQGDGVAYKTAEITYYFSFNGEKMMLQKVSVEYYDVSGEKTSFAEVEIYYGVAWTANTTGYDRLAGDSANPKMQVNMVLDHRTSNAHTVSYSLYNRAYVSVYPSLNGVEYKIYRDETATRVITTLADFGSVSEKYLYVVRTTAK